MLVRLPANVEGLTGGAGIGSFRSIFKELLQLHSLGTDSETDTRCRKFNRCRRRGEEEGLGRGLKLASVWFQ